MLFKVLLLVLTSLVPGTLGVDPLQELQQELEHLASTLEFSHIQRRLEDLQIAHPHGNPYEDMIRKLIQQVLDQVIEEAKAWLFKDLTVEIEVLKTDLTSMKTSLASLHKTVEDLNKDLRHQLANITDRVDDIKQDKWHLGMNLNPSDGHIMGYETGWHTGKSLGEYSSALRSDYISSRVWRQPANYIAIARHHSGILDAVKVWQFTNPGLSMLDRFQAMYPGREIATSGGPIQVFVDHYAGNLEDDPIFSVDGDLALNWGYSENGCRIALTGGHLSGESEDDDNTHGLGNNYAINPRTAQADGHNMAEWTHEIANIQDCANRECARVRLQGTDHGYGGKLTSGPVYGNYAIYVSETAYRFPTLTKSLDVDMDHVAE